MENNSIYPLIIMDYYPLRIDMNEDKNSIFICRNAQDVEVLLKAYHKEMGNLVKDIQIISEERTIKFKVADTYFDKNSIIEESDWYNNEVNFETLKVFKDGNKTT